MPGAPTPSSRPPPPVAIRVWTRLAPAAIFLGLAALSVLVWHQQVRHQRSLLQQHTEAVGLQASRRLEIFVQSRLTSAELFARRWASHEGRDFSETRFREFARVLVQAAPGFRVVRLVPPGGEGGWRVPESAPAAPPLPRGELRSLLEQSRRRGEPTLLSPKMVGGVPELLAALPLRRDTEFLGWLVVEFHIPTLIDDCFHHRIRAEFQFRLSKGAEELYRHPASGGQPSHGIRSSHRVRIGAEGWTLEMVPRRSHDIGYVAPGNLVVLGLGLLLSAAIALLTVLLGRRIQAYRGARDRAVDELRERQRAEEALRAAEAGYRSVFNAATDGILVLDDAGTVREANPAAGEMLGFPGESLVGVDVRTLLPADQTHLYDAFRRQLRQRGRVRLDAVAVREDGSSFDVEIRGTTYRQGGVRRILALLTDVSERKRAERKLAQLSRSVLMAQEAERARVARDLHDELGQILTALRLELGLLQKRPAKSPERWAEAWRGATELVEASAKELRRVCQGLRPPLLDDLGLGPAVEQMVERWQEHSGVVVELDLRLEDPDPALRPEIALSTYRILQESLTNIGRHARATEVHVSLLREVEALHLSVYDNGRGFELEATGQEGAGITGMSERANLVGGSLELRSVPHQGTRVTFRVALTPLRPAALHRQPEEDPLDEELEEGAEEAPESTHDNTEAATSAVSAREVTS